MSIKPLDLQTLFVKMDEVSKDQSVAKGQSALQQSQAARAQVDKEIADDHRVTGTLEDSEAQAVKDDDSEGSTTEHQENDEKKEAESQDSDPREVVTDPDIGRNIDLTG